MEDITLSASLLPDLIEATLGISFSPTAVSHLLTLADPSTLTKALHRAVKKEKPNAVATLVKYRADINGVDSSGWTALHHAIHYETSPAFIGFLIDLGADVNAKSLDGTTALHLAAEKDRNIPIINLLLEFSADVNATNAKGHSPLWVALARDSDETVRHLIENGASVAIAKAVFYNKIQSALP